jgi:hypothetical protein
MSHHLNWYAGWALIATAFATGAGLGMYFHHAEFWGGYTSFRRRIVRLGHIALAALGMMNVLFSVAVPVRPSMTIRAASVLLVIGAVSMGSVCFLTGWREGFRRLFFIPVTCLVLAVALILAAGAP